MKRKSATVQLIARAAQDLLKQRDWCQRAIARTRFGTITDNRKRSAVALDVVGALQLASQMFSPEWVLFYSDAFNVLDDYTRAKHGVDLITFNDVIASKKEHILAMFDAALA